MKDEIGNLEIEVSNLFELEQELKKQSVKEDRAGVLAAKAAKRVKQLELHVEIVTSTIVAEICADAEKNGRYIPPSALAEVRRSKVPLDERYQKAKNDLFKAMETSDILSKNANSWYGRKFLLTELSKIMNRTMFDSIA
jgi:hypothetical protein